MKTLESLENALEKLPTDQIDEKMTARLVKYYKSRKRPAVSSARGRSMGKPIKGVDPRQPSIDMDSLIRHSQENGGMTDPISGAAVVIPKGPAGNPSLLGLEQAMAATQSDEYEFDNPIPQSVSNVEYQMSRLARVMSYPLGED